jgi:DNA processing protein
MPLAPAALKALLRIALVPRIGAARLGALLTHFGSPERVLAAPAAQIAAVQGFGPDLARRVGAAAEPRMAVAADRALEIMERARAVAITPADLAYPEVFRRLPDAPYLVFASGRLDLLDALGVGIVGTRNPTPYGRNAAKTLSRDLVQAGFPIISGMARGIDAIAHQAALDGGGRTVGVLGHGIEQVYPAENRALFERMRVEGLLLTEFLPGEKPQPGNFPRRNRLIAALSRGIVVVEMALASGAQHTVNFALEQGRDVFAVPGPIGSAMSEGTNQLIKEGARVATSAADIVEELAGVGAATAGPFRQSPRREAGAQLSFATQDAAATDAAEQVLDGATAEEVQVFRVLSVEPKHVDELSAAADLRSDRLLATLLGLELRGAVEALPGKRFRRVIS